jgi:hypothetical protein
MEWKPLERRVYKYKKSYLDFYCPLCSSKRTLVSSGKLSLKNYLQIIFISIIFIVPTAGVMRAGSLIFLFIFWGLFEFCVRLYHRKEVICPYCGFDASWYKKDLSVAKKMVMDFFANKNTNSAHH